MALHLGLIAASRRHIYLAVAFVCILAVILTSLAGPSRFRDARDFRLLPSFSSAHTSSIAEDASNPAVFPIADPGEFWNWSTVSHFRPNGPARGKLSELLLGSSSKADSCAGFPHHLLETVQVVLKLGVAEQEARVKAVMSTVVRCISNLLIYSDLDYEVEGRRAYDVLAELPESYKLDNVEWDAYDRQKQAYANGDYDKGGQQPYHKDGWQLDVYKWIPMIEHAFASRPSAQWFVFMEADTYMFLDNLFQMLDNLDPEIPRYMGSPALGREDTYFAYGGCGLVVSRAALERLLKRQVGPFGEYLDPPLSHRYVENARMDCCGDSVTGWALWEHGVPLSGHWPHFNPHPLHSVPFGDAQWCQPVISLHKTSPEDTIRLSKWEEARRANHTGPLLYRDLSEFEPKWETSRSDWEACDWGGYPSEEGKDSLTACARACHEHGPCLQYQYNGGHCTFLNQIRWGHHKEPSEKPEDRDREFRRFHSGWHLDKIEKWKENHPCPEAKWMKPSIKRIF